MALLNIRKFPDPALKDPARPVANIDGGLASFIESMVQTMYAAPGVGLAAPQVGDSRRVVVLDTDHQNPGKNLLQADQSESRRGRGLRSFGRKAASR